MIRELTARVVLAVRSAVLAAMGGGAWAEQRLLHLAEWIRGNRA